MAESDEESNFDFSQKIPRARGGLIALMRDTTIPAEPEPTKSGVTELPIESIRFSPFQAREELNQTPLEELANSIAKKGILQPLLVRATGNDAPGAESYELIAGERRLRAAKLAGLTEVPVVIKDFSDREAAEAGIIENAQREDLNPVEEAFAYKVLVDHFGLNQGEIATAVCKNRVTISNALRLLQLPTEILELLRRGDLTAGHCRALLALKESEQMLPLAHKTIQRSLSVRVLEDLVSSINNGEIEGRSSSGDEEEDKAITRLQAKVSEYLGVEKVRVRLTPDGKKQLSVTFESEASWKRFVSKIKE